jgi:hypothetical protein
MSRDWLYKNICPSHDQKENCVTSLERRFYVPVPHIRYLTDLFFKFRIPLSGNKELLLPGENAINPFIGSKQHKRKRFFVREELFFGGSLPFFFRYNLYMVAPVQKNTAVRSGQFTIGGRKTPRKRRLCVLPA